MDQIQKLTGAVVIKLVANEDFQGTQIDGENLIKYLIDTLAMGMEILLDPWYAIKFGMFGMKFALFYLKGKKEKFLIERSIKLRSIALEVIEKRIA